MTSGSISSDSEAPAIAPQQDADAASFAVPVRMSERASRRLWIAACALLLLAAAILRLYNIELVPLHHDEGVNGFFLTNLFRDHIYHYDPENYHGPTLYYFALAIVYLLGLTTLAIRSTTALFGLGTIWLILMLRRRIGTLGTIAAATCVALSPGAIYFSRYFIHETPFVFFMLGMIVYWLKYEDDPWPGFLMVAAVMTGLLFATKETAIINAVALAAAAIGTRLYFPVRQRITKRASLPAEETPKKPGKRRRAQPVSFWGRAMAAVKDPLEKRRLIVWAAALGVCMFVIVMMYSSMFTYARGVKDAVRAFSFWTKTGETGHVHPWYSYVTWLWEEETPLLVLGLLGAGASLFLGKRRFAVFISLLELALLIGYSAVPYKTPWLSLSILIPLAITAGCGLEALYGYAKSNAEKALCIVLIVVAAGLLLRQAVVLNFYDYDDDRYAYVYAHTNRDIFGLLNKIDEIARRSGKGKDLTITITTTEYWPLPWYLRNFTRASFYGQMVNHGDNIIIGSTDQEAELQQTLGASYTSVGTFELRPGVELVLYAQQGL
ncbi:MAG TPA: flippase activity-associated protein Agl23 [Blastocatellia bacterium]|nr:flippase activity-associated protein Agl23 [Blastocatellia bacterium]